jgi:hypothetical protein
MAEVNFLCVLFSGLRRKNSFSRVFPLKAARLQQLNFFKHETTRTGLPVEKF